MNVVEFKNKIKKAQLEDVINFNKTYGADAKKISKIKKGE